ncbi:hypothetical protein WN51_00765 [Melipona quadrifasciata]|uniref:Uncharacterized protein n=1 Tax=Melipona quadrifasciata TaxID=166423 RepID=A0A0M8ZX02_9HYME|nr:hypothetical protein WN51_00765 [Melipona quadrifasciata]
MAIFSQFQSSETWSAYGRGSPQVSKHEATSNGEGASVEKERAEIVP